MKVVNGWTVPDLLSGAGKYMNRFREMRPVLEAALQKRPRGSAVQAGGHVGTWPIGISRMGFGTVWTFEPEDQNYAALCANIKTFADPTVRPTFGFLGPNKKTRGLRVSEKNTGQHRVGGKGTIATTTVDELALEDCDLICLDVEGYEIPALMGAVDTLERCQPVVLCEENKRCIEQGYKIGDLDDWMRRRGYRIEAQQGEDLVFVPNNQV